MSKLTKNYIAVNEGKLAKSEFLRQVRQGFPGVVSQFNNYDDTVNILRKRGLLSEEVIYQCKGDRFSLEAINRGIRQELRNAGVTDLDELSPEEYKKIKHRVIDNLDKNPLYYLERETVLERKVVEEPKQKVPRDRSLDHDWSVDDYKVAYVSLEFGTKGNQRLLQGKDLVGMKPTSVNVAINVINTTDAGLKQPKEAMRLYLLGQLPSKPDERNEWLASYNHNKNFLAAVKELQGKDLETCIASINFNNVGNDEEAAQKLQTKHEDKLKKNADRRQDKNDKDREEKRELNRMFGTAQAVAVEMRRKFSNINQAAGVALIKAFRTKENLSKAKTRGILKGDLLKGYPYAEKYFNKQATETLQENKMQNNLLRETITKKIVSILSEAATTNLAQFSDQNASIQNIPAILNSLENIVTEIESFILKEQTKIQGVFDSIGDIKNEDNIPVGYKFVQPILDAFKKDLEPVLQKINFENIKLPEAPEPDQTEVNNIENPEMEEPEPKKTVFSPQGASLTENKQPKKKYTA